MVLNYIIQRSDFRQIWIKGFRSAVFSTGTLTDTYNHKEVTVLPLIEKIFKIIVYRKMPFVNEFYDEIDIDVFLANNRTYDNKCVLHGSIQLQHV